MRLNIFKDATWSDQRDEASALPAPMDSERLILLRAFLTPILETARDWRSLRDTLADKGYGLSFRHGRLVIHDAATGSAVCTGNALGVPLKQLAQRIGRPRVRLNQCGETAALSA